MREQLAWFDDRSNRYLTAEERTEQEHREKERLAQHLRSLGIDSDRLLMQYQFLEAGLHMGVKGATPPRGGQSPPHSLIQDL